MPYYDLAEMIYQWHGSTSLLCSPSTAQRKKKKSTGLCRVTEFHY